jgi:SAM-dependent methyltransferase
MIKKAVYTYWDTPSRKTNCGCNDSKEFACLLSLSLSFAKKQFEHIELVTNDYGKSILIDHYKLPFDSVSLALNDIEVKDNCWAYPKIVSYSIQTIPFIHIDSDVILIDKIKDDVLSKDMFFQNIETYETHAGYSVMEKDMVDCKAVLPDYLKNNSTKFGLNCGVVGVNDLSIVSIWKKEVDNLINNPKNKKFVSKQYINHCFEQLFISKIIKQNNKNFGVLIENFSYSTCKKPSFKMIHLWGLSKKEKVNVDNVKRILAKQESRFSQVLDIDAIDLEHEDVFEDIYKNNKWGNGSGAGSSPEQTKEFRDWLSTFLIQNKVKSIVDLGCGDWQFMKLVDLSGIAYTGVDVVKSVIDNNISEFAKEGVSFFKSDIKKYECLECDLLIVKDVLIHWSNKEIKQFINKIRKAKRVILVNDKPVIGHQFNQDIRVGEFRQLDLSKQPFQFEGENVFEYNTSKLNDSGKIVFLIENLNKK